MYFFKIFLIVFPKYQYYHMYGKFSLHYSCQTSYAIPRFIKSLSEDSLLLGKMPDKQGLDTRNHVQ